MPIKFSAMVVTALALAGAALPSSASEDPTAVYRRALSAMQALPIISYATFDTGIKGDGIHINISKGDAGKAEVNMQMGSAQQTWHSAYRQGDRVAAITLPDKQIATTHMPIFDPTWQGAYAWLRFGLRGVQPAASTPMDTVSATENAMVTQSTPDPSAPPTVIATVTAVAAPSYLITDAPDQPCPDGAPGLALNLVPRDASGDRPLRLVVIDRATNRFCAMRFALRGGSGIMHTSGSVELHFKNVEGQWLVSDGVVEIEARVLGFGVKHGSIAFTHERIAFPTTLDDSAFGSTNGSH